MESASGSLPENGNAEAFAVLEGVMLARMVAKLLSDGELTRWLSWDHPRELAALHAAGQRGYERHER